MKNIRWLLLVAFTTAPLFTAFAQAPAAAAPPPLSPAAAEVLKLAQSGTSDDVLLAYIQNSSTAFGLTADQILYLKDVGVSQTAISSMLNRDAALRGQPQQYSYQQRLYPPTTPPPAEPAPPVAAAPEPAAPVPTEPPPPAPAPAPTYVSSPPPDVAYFYQDLSPYGTWVDLPGYGWSWQPTVVVVNRAWRPYCDSGHWVWTDAGWYWVSDYSWGWAPFHYGRWCLHDRCGWVWVPDRVWGPSWVCWRSSGDYCGWAPLPPHAVFDVRLGWSFNGVRVGADFDFGLHVNAFAFIGFGDFCAHDLGHRCLAPARVTTIYKTTVVNNTYIVNNNTIVNQGIKVERVAAATHTEIHKAAIRDLPAGSARSTHVVADKSGPVVYRPQLTAPAKSVKMVAQKLDERHPVIQHTEMAPVRAETKSTYTPSRTTTTTAPGTRQVETPRTVAPSANEKPTVPRQDYSSPKSHQTLRSTPVAPADTRAPEQPRQVAHSTPAPQPEPAQVSTSSNRRPVEEPKSTPRSYPSFKPATEPSTYPLRTAPKPSAEANSSASEGMSSHTYYPKSYHQATDVRSLPPLNSREESSSASGNSSGHSSKKD